MTQPSSKSVIICGGGVVGLFSAYYLAKAGFRVTVLDQNPEGADSCAHGSAGYLSPSHVIPLSAPGMVVQGLKWMLSSRSPFYIQPRLDWDLIHWAWLFARSCSEKHLQQAAPILRDLCLGGRTLFADFAVQTNNAFEMKTEGLVNLCRTAEGLDHEAHGLARIAGELGVEAKVLDARQTALLEPGTKLNVAGSVYFPIDAHISPRLLMPLLVSRLKALGVALRWNTRVLGWHRQGDRIASVKTDAGDLPADEFILTGGSWSPAMVSSLGLRLPMQPGKGYSLTLEQPRFQLTKSLMLTERRVAVTPMGPRLRFGGTMEISGHSGNVRPERIAQIIAAAQDYLPEFTAADFNGVKPWFGYRPVSPDGLPYLGRFRHLANFSTASGHAMLGLTMAPISGLVLAELLTGRKPSVDLRLLAPDRYA